jgi:hypothetical protein
MYTDDFTAVDDADPQHDALRRPHRDATGVVATPEDQKTE